MNRNQRVALLFGLLLIGAVMLGCASSSRVAAPAGAYADDLDRARNSVTAAEQAGAAEYGNAELTLAREKLREADRAIAEGETERARRLAAEAELDAEVAVAINRNRETQELVTAARANLQALEEELRRGETGESSAH